LRRPIGAGREDNLASGEQRFLLAVAMDRDAAGAATLEQHTQHEGVGENAQVRRRMEIRGSGAASNAVALRYGAPGFFGVRCVS
jgi:hypothetical protein